MFGFKYHTSFSLATKIQWPLNKKHTVYKDYKNKLDEISELVSRSPLLSLYLPPHHLRPLSILLVELKNTKNIIHFNFFIKICFPCPPPVSVFFVVVV